MKEKLKAWWTKFRLFVVGALAALVFVFLIFKRTITGGLGDFLKSEAEAKDEADRKLAEGTAKIQKEKEEKLQKEEKDKEAALRQAEERAAEERKRLKRLDSDSFKRELEKYLGIKEKKND